MSGRRRRKGTAGGRVRLREGLLNVAAVGGAICILMTIAAVAFGITLIMFKTGSMDPAIPAGSVAVVKEVPAAEAQAGDVVTVERPGLLPVTHRVVDVESSGDGLTVLRLKGDANEVEDPEPYSVKTVRTVLWSVPGLAPVIAAASTPFALGAMAVAVACLVTWVFWPRTEGG